MMNIPLLLLSLASSFVICVQSQLTLNLKADNSYEIFQSNVSKLQSAPVPYAIRSNGVVLSSADGSLKADGAATPITGSDPFLGPFTGYSISWNAGIFITDFKVFNSGDAIVFAQRFPAGLLGMSGGDKDGLSTGFPVFFAPQNTLKDSATGFVTWKGGMCSGKSGAWTASSTKGNVGGSDSGPVVLFDTKNIALVLSPLSNFMTAHLAFANIVGDSFGSGLGGMVTQVPAGWSYETLLVSSESGITAATLRMGAVLLARGGKSPTAPDADVAVSTLGYWTDNGAYYYYNSENNTIVGNMQQTISDVITYWASLSLPLKHLMYDSWWYWKECPPGSKSNTWLACKGAVELWEPRDDVFPDGFNFQPPNLPLVLHNRWFSANNNTYINDLGFADSFIVESAVDFALPIKSDVFLYLMGRAKKWGMTVYEQDWLITVWESMSVTKANVTAASSWLAAMADAASELGLTIQYCMPLPRHMLESTKHQAVTNARASGDYHPGATNWDLGTSSLFYWAIGIAPSKDDWWTTEVQVGNPYTDKPTEPNWQLQAITIALSTGPNGPSDAINHTNATLVMTTVNTAGITLQPDRPATTNNRAFLTQLASGVSYLPKVRTTHTAFAENSWFFVNAVSLTADFTMSLADLGTLSTASPAYAIYDYFAPGQYASLVSTSGTGSFTIPQGQGQPSAPSAALPIRYWIAAPQLPGGWFLFGEANKIVTISKQRISSFSLLADGFSATINVMLGETVTMLVAPSSGTTVAYACQYNAQKLAVLTCSSGACACA